jgi:hypothetical protein
MNQNYISRLKIKCLILLLFLLVYPAYSQTSENYAETIPDYEYGLGQGVGRALADNCSAALTSIGDVKVSQSQDLPLYDEFNIKLSVIKYYRFLKDRKKGEPEINLSYQKPRKIKEKPTGKHLDWSLLVNMIEGNKAIIFNCRDGKEVAGYNSFITTDVAYFDKIERAIALTERFRADYVNALDYFANDYKSDDELRKGTALNFLFSAEIPGDVKAYIFVNLLSESPLSKQREGWFVKTDIRDQLLANYTSDAPPQFRKQAFIKLVQIANGENENAMDATEILAQIARSNPDELRPYLKSGKTENIITHLQKIHIIGDASLPDALMKLLSEQ